MELKYLRGYPEEILKKVEKLINNDSLGKLILGKYPNKHNISSDKLLYSYVMELKNRYLRKSDPLSKVAYDSKIEFSHQALGLHSYVPRKQGNKIKVKNEIKIASQFKNMPEEFLRNIVVHELAHLKEKGHDKAFYKLCLNMERSYHQVEFDMRLYLTYMDIFKKKLY